MKEGINPNPESRKPTFDELRAIVDTYYPAMEMSDAALKLLIESGVIRLDPFDVTTGGLKIHSEEDGI